ncbi:MAG: heavy metal-responsive transcriptional regulator [Moraxellaceae bacterium]|jgi:DNA-binding transcriptional MerR regulator|nr:heavy metal-responsive transcriptional regulator [Moraxellaceae bacterium]
MNIGKLAEATGVTPDTLRYYEKEGLIDAPQRGANGYRRYDATHLTRLRFVRNAQALGFSLAEIREVLPRLAAGAFGREEIEARLHTKLAEIDAHIRQLENLKQELRGTFAQLTCAPGQTVSFAGATPEVAESAGARKPQGWRGSA